jgi:phosphatidylserine decarboxylase
MLKHILCPVHREGWLFLAIAAIVAFMLGKFSPHLGWIGALVALWVAYFFRDPARVTPQRPGLVISPADGLVQSIVMAPLPPELGRGGELWQRVAVFMNVFDVHINRAPIDATIKEIKYIPGKFLNASLDKASVDNERQIFVLSLADGREIVMVQIAGLVARRILRWVNAGDAVKAGFRVGMIRFGSRVDVYLPAGTTIQAIEGQRVRAGESVLADLRAQDAAWQGVRQ